MRLVHFSDNPALKVEFKKQSEGGPPFKPRGLWVSDEEDPDQGWKAWSLREEWNLEGLKFEYEIHLVEHPDLCILTTVEDIHDFTFQFASDDADKGTVWEIDWDEVRKYANGIIITPYQVGCRCDPATIWYNGWDCASGCIWNPEIIDLCQKLF